MLAVTFTGFFLLFLPCWSEGSQSIIDRLFHYSAPARRYGMGLFIPEWGKFTIPYLAAACLFPFFIRKMELVRQILLGMLFFLVFTPIIGIQYFVLPIAFGTLRPSKWFFIYSVVGTFFILGSPVNLHVEWLSLVRGNYLWASAAAWFVAECLRTMPSSPQASARTHGGQTQFRGNSQFRGHITY